MNFDELIQAYKLKLPPFNNFKGETDIRLRTENHIQDFIHLVNEVDENSFILLGAEKSIILNQLQIQNNKITKAIDSFLNGDIIECYNIIFQTYFDINDGIKNLFYKPLPARVPFYRMRVNNTNQLFSEKEMFHIPFELIHKTNNQRFSLSGYPCLYLGNSSYICWEELNKPNLNNCNFSILGNEEALNFFDLTPPNIIKNQFDILRFPLIIASSIKCSPQKSTFKPEYIIPQAILHSLIRFNKVDFKSFTKTINHIDGIIYLSPLISNGLMFDDLNHMHNYVIPTINKSASGYCKRLSQLFIISEGQSINNLWLRFPQIFADIDEDVNDKYNLSVFNIIEKYLKSKNVKKSFIHDQYEH